jgi:hypothetical protein
MVHRELSSGKKAPLYHAACYQTTIGGEAADG